MRSSLLVIFLALSQPASAVSLRRPEEAQANKTAPAQLHSNVTTQAEKAVDVNGTQAWDAVNTDLNEDTVDAMVWRTGKPPHFVGQATLPPKCPQDVPADAPYWSEKHYPDRSHCVCEYAGGCHKMFTNRERFESIQRALAMTKQTLDAQGIGYVLYGGSAIGQYRCGNVLPWDADCDVLVKMSDVPKLRQSLGELGNNFILKTKSSVIPFAFTDKATGLYCDVFTMDFEEYRDTVAVAWPWAMDGPCPQFPEWSHQPGVTMKCERYPLSSVTPYAPCVMNGLTHTCANDQATYLSSKYGAGWNSPNVSTSYN